MSHRYITIANEVKSSKFTFVFMNLFSFLRCLTNTFNNTFVECGIRRKHYFGRALAVRKKLMASAVNIAKKNFFNKKKSPPGVWKLAFTSIDLNIDFNSFFTHMCTSDINTILKMHRQMFSISKTSQSIHKKYLLYVQTAFFLDLFLSFRSVPTSYHRYDHFKLQPLRFAMLKSAVVSGSFVLYTYTTYFYNI